MIIFYLAAYVYYGSQNVQPTFLRLPKLPRLYIDVAWTSEELERELIDMLNQYVFNLFFSY